MNRPPGCRFAAISFCTGVVPASRSFGAVWVNWLVNPIRPTSTATKTAARRYHDTLPRRGRIQTRTAAPTQKARAIAVASRTVSVMAGRSDTPANSQTSVRGDTKAQMANPATTAAGTNAMIRSYRVMGSRNRGVAVRSIHPAKRTQTAVATVIMLRLCRRWFP